MVPGVLKNSMKTDFLYLMNFTIKKKDSMDNTNM